MVHIELNALGHLLALNKSGEEMQQLSGEVQGKCACCRRASFSALGAISFPTNRCPRRPPSYPYFNHRKQPVLRYDDYEDPLERTTSVVHSSRPAFTLSLNELPLLRRPQRELISPDSALSHRLSPIMPTTPKESEKVANPSPLAVAPQLLSASSPLTFRTAFPSFSSGPPLPPHGPCSPQFQPSHTTTHPTCSIYSTPNHIEALCNHSTARTHEVFPLNSS